MLPDEKHLIVYSDPDYAHMSLGTLSAILEIGLLRKICTTLPQMQYYHLGYYLSSCPKLAYKANFGPFELLGLDDLRWKLNIAE